MLHLSPQLSTALQRGAYIGGGTLLVIAAGAFLKTHDLAASLLLGLTAAVTVLGGRGALEGLYDTKRAAAMDVRPSDVGWKQAG